MSDDKSSEILRDALLAEKEVPVEEEVEEYLKGGWLTPSGVMALQEGRSQFARMALAELHPEPVHEIKIGQTFGQWLRETRERARLTVEMVAAALGKDNCGETEEVEDGELSPSEWLEGQDAANFCELFRIHFSALLRLIENSSYTQEPWWYKALLYPDSDHIGSWQGSHSPPRSYPNSQDVSMYHWLYDLRKELERRRAYHLLE